LAAHTSDARVRRADIVVIAWIGREVAADARVAFVFRARCAIITNSGCQFAQARLSNAGVLSTRITIITIDRWIETTATRGARVFSAWISIIALGRFVGTGSCIRVAVILCTRISIITGFGRVLTPTRDGVAEVHCTVVAVTAFFGCEIALACGGVTCVCGAIISINAIFDVVVATAIGHITTVRGAQVSVVALAVSPAAFVLTPRQTAVQLADATNSFVT